MDPDDTQEITVEEAQAPTPDAEAAYYDARQKYTRISENEARDNVRAYFDKAEVGEDGKKLGWDWYKQENEHIQQASQAPGVNESPEVFAAQVSNTSANNSWDQNIATAQRVARLANDHPDVDPKTFVDSLEHSGYLKDRVVKGFGIHRGEDPQIHLGDKKLYNFYHNLADPDGTGDMVTMDRWMHRAILNREPRSYESTYFREGGYDWGADIIRSIAKDVGYTPQQVQAIVWTEIKKNWKMVIK